MSGHETVIQAGRAPLKFVMLSTLALAIILLAACDSSAKTQPTATVVSATATPLPPTSLVVVRLSGFVEQNRVAPFQMASQDVAKVQQLYQTARSLPPDHNAFGCTQSLAIGYELSFMHGDTLVAQVLMIYGCRLLEVSGLPGCREWPPTFTAQIAATLGIPVTTLEPTPPNSLLNTAGPNGPFAQGVPTEPVLVLERCSY